MISQNKESKLARTDTTNTSTITAKHRSVPLRDTITHLGRGYPDKLTLFKIPASSYWWVRYYTQGKLVKKSTKTENQKEAVKFAKEFYETILLRERNLLPVTSSPTFERCAWELIEEQQQRIDRGELNPRLNKNDESALRADILPFFTGMDVRAVNYKHLNAFIAKLSERSLSSATLKKHLNLVSKILRLAHRENLIDRLPALPKIKIQDSPRGWFSPEEYEHLKKTADILIKKKVKVRYHQITDEMKHLITFMVNTFLRPSDIKTLRHRNIEVVRGTKKYLRITTEESKTTKNSVVSMNHAVGIYEDIKKIHQLASKDDYVFLPEIKNREFALQTMRRQFDEILKDADLKHSKTGEPRTLYSLRHTALMFRLINGGDIDLLTLARNARTSVGMIDRFYGKHLNAEMNVEKIHSMKSSKTNTKRSRAN